MRILLVLGLVFGVGLLASTRALADHVYSLQWGSVGTGDGQFGANFNDDYGGPWGIVVDAAGDLYVADTYNHRIQKFSDTGTYLGQWGSFGTGNGQFKWPFGLAIDAAGDIYVADSGNSRVQKFSSSGSYLTQFGTLGQGPGEFVQPWSVAVDASGNIYVSDYHLTRVQKLTSAGVYVTEWGPHDIGTAADIEDLAIDPSGQVVMAVSGELDDVIQVLDANGNFLSQWGSNAQFDFVAAVATGTTGTVYVVNKGGPPHTQEFTPSGGYLGQIPYVFAPVNQHLQLPRDVAVGPDESVYVTDPKAHKVWKFVLAATPAFPASWGSIKHTYR